MAYPYNLPPASDKGSRKPKQFDPYTGLARTNQHIYAPTPREILRALGVLPTSLAIQRKAAAISALANLNTYPKNQRLWWYVYPGYGLLPRSDIGHPQYLPDERPRLYRHRRRAAHTLIDVQTGQRHSTRPDNKPMGETFMLDGRKIYRACAVAATALGYNPDSPVMAWYIADPLLEGFGIDNIYTPTLAGAYRIERNAQPPQPDESMHDINPDTSTRFVFTPWHELDKWPFPEPPTIYDWQDAIK